MITTIEYVQNQLTDYKEIWFMHRYLPDGYVDYATYNIKEILQFLQQLLGMISESW